MGPGLYVFVRYAPVPEIEEDMTASAVFDWLLRNSLAVSSSYKFLFSLTTRSGYGRLNVTQECIGACHYVCKEKRCASTQIGRRNKFLSSLFFFVRLPNLYVLAHRKGVAAHKLMVPHTQYKDKVIKELTCGTMSWAVAFPFSFFSFLLAINRSFAAAPFLMAK